mmetsp:Transcript_20756/g.29142  ORF Transcript_20756/g.29142 Transcript_20756/m.29142 type:complete len:97 (+) Transcript_20756:525-815(+)
MARITNTAIATMIPSTKKKLFRNRVNIGKRVQIPSTPKFPNMKMYFDIPSSRYVIFTLFLRQSPDQNWITSEYIATRAAAPYQYNIWSKNNPTLVV